MFSLKLSHYLDTIEIMFDIPELPDRPLHSWSEFNRCRLGLKCTGIVKLEISEVPELEKYTIQPLNIEDFFHITLKSPRSFINTITKSVELIGPRVYFDETSYS